MVVFKKLFIIVYRNLNYNIFLCSVFNALHMFLGLLGFALFALVLTEKDLSTSLPFGTVPSLNEGVFYLNKAWGIFISSLIFVLSLLFHSLYRVVISRIKRNVLKSIENDAEVDVLAYFCIPSLKKRLKVAAVNISYTTLPSMLSAFCIISISFFIDTLLGSILIASFLVSMLLFLTLWYFFIYLWDGTKVVDSWKSAVITGVSFAVVVWGGYWGTSESLFEIGYGDSTAIILLVLLLRVIYGSYKTSALGFFRAMDGCVEEKLEDKLYPPDYTLNVLSELKPGFYCASNGEKLYTACARAIYHAKDKQGFSQENIFIDELSKSVNIIKYKGISFCPDDLLQGVAKAKWSYFMERHNEEGVFIILGGTMKRHSSFEAVSSLKKLSRVAAFSTRFKPSLN